jgi:hypothetical protein
MGKINDISIFGHNLCDHRTKPDPKKNTISNYDDHMICRGVKFERKIKELNRLLQSGDIEGELSIANQEVLARINFLDPLIDKYDYFDEIFGATGMPLLTGLAALGAAGYGLIQGAQSLSIGLGLIQDDGEHHAKQALGYFCVAAIALVATIVGAITHGLSLLTRPIATAIEGWKESDENRFLVENSVQSTLGF